MDSKHLGRLAGAALAALACGATIHGCGGSSSGGGGGLAASTAAGATPAATTSGTPAATTTSSAPAGPAPRTRTAVTVARHGEGFLELHHGTKKVLHTKGTSYERGVQYGYLLGDEVEGVLGKLPAYAAQAGGNLAAYAQALVTPVGAAVMRPYFDQDALEQLRGIVDGMRLRNPATWVTEQDLVFVNALIDIGAVVDLDVFRCSGLAVWGDITRDGKLFQTRNVDLMIGSGLEDHAVVVIEKPTGGVPYLNPGWAGMIGCASGLNAQGLGVSQVWAFSREKGFGRPWVLTMRQALGQCTGVEEVVAIHQADRRTYGSNFVLADPGHGRGGVPRGISIEVTQRQLSVFDSDDPREDQALWNGQPYAIRVPWAVFRGDSYMDPLLRATQTASNGPTGDPRSAGAYRNRYQGQAEGILRYVRAGQKIGPDECIQITRDVAMRNNSLQCVVYANHDLEVWLANSRIDRSGATPRTFDANTETYFHYSLEEYTPTAQAVPDRTSAARGEDLQLAVPIRTWGRARALDVRVGLDLGGAISPLGALGTVVLGDRGQATLTGTITVPAGLPNVGRGDLVVELVEAGTGDLVDIARTTFTVTP